MKVFFSGALALLVSTAAFGDATFSGEGWWRSTDGERGTWEEEATFSRSDEGLQIASELSILQDDVEIQAFSSTVEYRRTEANFFDIYEDGEKIGSGFCTRQAARGPRARQARSCHMIGETDSGRWQESIRFDRRRCRLHKQGSHTMTNDEGDVIRVLYRGTLNGEGDCDGDWGLEFLESVPAN